MGNNKLNKTKQIRDLLDTLEETPHVVEFAEKCAERAEQYWASAYSANVYAASADVYAADVAAYANAEAAYANAAYAAAAEDYANARAAYANAAYANAESTAAINADDGSELELQIKHLKELHAWEGS